MRSLIFIIFTIIISAHAYCGEPTEFDDPDKEPYTDEYIINWTRTVMDADIKSEERLLHYMIVMHAFDEVVLGGFRATWRSRVDDAKAMIRQLRPDLVSLTVLGSTNRPANAIDLWCNTRADDIERFLKRNDLTRYQRIVDNLKAAKTEFEDDPYLYIKTHPCYHISLFTMQL
jgi:hypothetical protein